MFEIIISCVILLAVCYWAVLWLMGRREDVLHGEFVEAGAQAEEPVRSVFPKWPARKVQTARQNFAEKPVFPAKPVITAKPDITEKRVQAAIAEPAVQTVLPEQPAFRQERLESLLSSIKRDLNQLVQK
ncbi:hypothetical protein [Bradyrhizobium sp. JYMT SZCCT0180]|uniref:hypothetical protein n=1 Tax=Bradyrhizobium sp. JYMT SZCCT0180 TaxID=2807666 RepID=UPI001BA91051|nr:hypothetical protein [Bradyrhizobium sp. JYMT SZCCT0180]MBR1211337.1 hypothetical protein [Bradyrhizobium sp. JYMT SZCCT0180]